MFYPEVKPGFISFIAIGITFMKTSLSFSEIKSKTVIIPPTAGLFKYA